MILTGLRRRPFFFTTTLIVSKNWRLEISVPYLLQARPSAFKKTRYSEIRSNHFFLTQGSTLLHLQELGDESFYQYEVGKPSTTMVRFVASTTRQSDLIYILNCLYVVFKNIFRRRINCCPSRHNSELQIVK